ncbi:MAG: DUF3867 family protein [Clostridiaceae bacterium]
MSDVIDLNKFKNKVRDKDINELENYIYSLYYKLAEGKLTMAELNVEVSKYLADNNISETKFMEIQKKLIERYGYDPSIVDQQFGEGSLNLRIASTLKTKYGNSLTEGFMIKKTIKNDRNDVTIICSSKEVFIYSQGSVDIEDNELNEFLVSYKRQCADENLKIVVSSNTSSYDY